MKKSKDPTKVVSIVLTESLYEALSKFCDAKKWNMSVATREALKVFLRIEEK